MSKIRTPLLIALLGLTYCTSGPFDNDLSKDYSKWTTYAGTKDGSRYSSLDQINVDNVQALQIAWRYSSGDKDPADRSQNQCNPIVIDNILYATSPQSKLMALNAATGKELWTFDPAAAEAATDNLPSYYKVIRGTTYWEDDEQKRILYSIGTKLFSIDALTGRPVTSFGTNGTIDLSEDLDRPPEDFNPFVANTTPGIIYKDLLIVGHRAAESADGAPGHIRAFDVRTGKRKWIFHTIPHPGETGYETWPDKEAWKQLGGANNWAGMSLDEERGIVYVPTGSISGDFYGGFREGQNLFANSLVALEASTGKYLWHFQIVHHDLWDRDLPANPNLVTLHKDGKTIDAVAQITKHGHIFLFDRTNGNPIFAIEEKPVPQNALPGEYPWPTQPVPTLPEPFARQYFGESDVTNLSPQTHQAMLEKYRKIKHTEMFTPPSKEGNWIFPGFDGGGEWGGAAVDPETQIMYVNSSELPWAQTMVDINSIRTREELVPGRTVYDTYCFSCHGADLKGVGTSYPSLINIQQKYSLKELETIINNGRNMMPSFKHIPDDKKSLLITFLSEYQENKKTKETEMAKEPGAVTAKNAGNILDQVPYAMTGYNRFLDDEGYPGITPPWGTLNAVDLNSGKLLWKVVLGEYPELTEKGIAPTGTENYGGPVVTRGGVVFIAATKDSKIRAFDKKTGKTVWEASLPVPGYATPAVYMVDGKEYVVIACGGGKIGSPSGDEYVAFSLPD